MKGSIVMKLNKIMVTTALTAFATFGIVQSTNAAQQLIEPHIGAMTHGKLKLEATKMHRELVPLRVHGALVANIGEPGLSIYKKDIPGTKAAIQAELDTQIDAFILQSGIPAGNNILVAGLPVFVANVGVGRRVASPGDRTAATLTASLKAQIAASIVADPLVFAGGVYTHRDVSRIDTEVRERVATEMRTYLHAFAAAANTPVLEGAVPTVDGLIAGVGAPIATGAALFGGSTYMIPPNGTVIPGAGGAVIGGGNITVLQAQALIQYFKDTDHADLRLVPQDDTRDALADTIISALMR